MDREELRDQLLAPVLQWIRLGREVNALMLRSLEAVGECSTTLLRSATLRERPDWSALGAMNWGKATIPLESAVAMGWALQSEMQHFLSESSEAGVALAGNAIRLATIGSVEDFRKRQAPLGDALLKMAMPWYQLSGRAAEVLEQGLQPMLRAEGGNAGRPGRR